MSTLPRLLAVERPLGTVLQGILLQPSGLPQKSWLSVHELFSWRFKDQCYDIFWTRPPHAQARLLSATVAPETRLDYEVCVVHRVALRKKDELRMVHSRRIYVAFGK